MVGKKGALKYIASTYTGKTRGDYFLSGRKRWGWILLTVIIAAVWTGHDLTNVVPTAARVLMRRTPAMWGVASPTKIIRIGIIEVLVWEATALLGTVLAGVALYRNTD